jgi:acetyltransferase-like isoleucine patch superfamily enzyme
MFFKKIIRHWIPRTWIVRIRGLFAPKCKMGCGAYIAPSVQLIGTSNISIGNNSFVSERTLINVNQRQSGQFEVVIGDNCFIGRENFFSSGKAIHIGHYTLTTTGCKFICSSHVIDNPMVPYMSSGTTSSDTIRVGVNCFFGACSVVIGNVSIGWGSVIGASALITADVPPFSVVVGSPARVIKRYSFFRKQWIDIDMLAADEELGYPDEATYLEKLQTVLPNLSMPLIATSSHFGNL